MTYKGMLLGALLVPCTIFSNDATDARIQQLKNDLDQKELQLSELGKMIEEKQAWIDSILKAQQNHYSLVLAMKKSDEEKKLFKENLDFFHEQLDKIGWVEEDLQKFLTDRSLNNVNHGDEIERIKAWCIRYGVEYHLLNNLIKRYEQCLQEFITIEFALKNLSITHN